MQQDNLIGRQVANFRIDSLLGRGGMGQVYYGWDVKLQRPVAIKVIDNRFRADSDYIQRFISEARVVATWRHENIIQVYYADEEEDLYYFVMEYVPGKSLGEILAEQTKDGALLPVTETLRIGRAIARALDYAHQQGVIHRDVKPQNVLIAKDGRVVLTDFGLALYVDKGSQGEAFGTAHYIAPEQARRSANAVPQSDLYALGVILYEMLTGAVPFDDPSPTSVALQHITQTPPSPRALNPSLRPETEKVMLKALEKEPNDRYPSGRELMDALEKALKNGPQISGGMAIELPPPPAAESSAAYSLPFDIKRDDPLIGKKIDEFKIEALIGQGGMGRVYRAFDTRLHSQVAFKIVDPAYRSKPDYFMRFEREAKAIETLEHVNIVQLYHYRETDGVLYMALQYVEGTDLHVLMSQHRQARTWMNVQDILHIISEICSALDHMHEKGVIHRDLKPANVMMTKQGHVVITDFGLALLAEIGTQGKIFGSPRYMAPEQVISSANATPQSDLYSVGVILYEMFTGETPFQANEPMEMALQQMSEKPPVPSTLRPEITPELDAIMLKALAKEPKNRYKSGSALIEDLNRAIQKLPRSMSDRAAPASIPSLSEKRPSDESEGQIPGRRPAGSKKFPVSRWALLAGGLLLILLAASWVFWGSGNFGIKPSLTASSLNTTAQTPDQATATKSLQQAIDTSVSASPVAVQSQQATSSPTSRPSLTATSIPPTQPPTTTPNIRTIRTEDLMPMMLVPASTFWMGAANDDPNAEFDERPQHEVYLDAYYIDQYEVTVAQYAAFLNTKGKHTGSPCLSSSCALTKSELHDNSHMEFNGRANTYRAEAGFENYPMNSVTWFGAQAYCEWIEGRLPTESEWEFAARGPDERVYPWGNQAPDETRAIFNQEGFSSLKAVDALPDGASYFGLLNMAGSLIEWVSDTYVEDFYATLTGKSINPLGPPSRYRTPRVLRGGSWQDSAIDLRASARRGVEPLTFKLFGIDVGFRCVRPIAPPSNP